MDAFIVNGEDGSISVTINNGGNPVVSLVVPPTVNPALTMETAYGRCVFGPAKATPLSPVVEITNQDDVTASVSLEESETPTTTARTPYGEVIVGPAGSSAPPPPEI